MPPSACAKIAGERARSVYLLGRMSSAKDNASKDHLQQLINPPTQLSTFSSVHYLLVTNGSFWANSSLQSLWLLLSTSHELRKLILGIFPKDTAIFKTIMKTIFEQHTSYISIHDAMQRFALSMPTLFTLNTIHPQKYAPLLRKSQLIEFKDAFNLAVDRKGGMESMHVLRARAQARVDRAMKKAVVVADEVQRESADQLATMLCNVKTAIRNFKSKPSTLDFRFKINSFKSLRDNIGKSETMVSWLRYVIDTPELACDRSILKRARKSVEDCIPKTMHRYNLLSHVGKYGKMAFWDRKQLRVWD